MQTARAAETVPRGCPVRVRAVTGMSYATVAAAEAELIIAIAFQVFFAVVVVAVVAIFVFGRRQM